jgi:hypothetical protein
MSTARGRGRDAREGDGGDDHNRKRPAQRKPVDRFGAIPWNVDGSLRQLLEMILRLANHGPVPELLTKGTGVRKPPHIRHAAIRKWCTGLEGAPAGVMAARFTELSEALVHVLRAAIVAGHFEDAVTMVTSILTRTAEIAREAEEEGEEEEF